MRFLKVLLSINLMMSILLTFSYGDWIQEIKHHEGIRLTPYEDIFTIPTIGYGHVIKKNEQLHVITVAFADTLLKRDFDASLRLVTNLYPEKREQQLLALAHFVYAKGIGNFTRSNLKKAIDSNASNVVLWKEWIEWAQVKGVYRHKSMYIRSLEYFNYIQDGT